MMVNLDDLLEGQFLLEYYCGMQPSEVEALSSYEFKKKLRLLNKYKTLEAEARAPKKSPSNALRK